MRHLEDRRPVYRIRYIGVHGKARGREIAVDAGDQETLGPGEALKGGIHRPPHGAAAAVGADEIAAADGLDSAGCFEPRIDAVGALRRVEKPVLPMHRATQRLEALQQQRRELELLAVKPEGIWRQVGDQRQVPLDDHAFATAADLPMWHAIAQRQELLADADGIEHLQRRRMEAAGAQVAWQAGLRFVHGDGDILERKPDRDRKAGGPAAHDNHRRTRTHGDSSVGIRPSRTVSCQRAIGPWAGVTSAA